MPGYIKLAQLNFCKYPVCIGFRWKSRLVFCSIWTCSLTMHHKSTCIFIDYLWPHHYIQLFCCIVALISSAQLTLLIFPAPVTHLLCFYQPPAWCNRESVRLSAHLTNTYVCEEFTQKDKSKAIALLQILCIMLYVWFFNRIEGLHESIKWKLYAILCSCSSSRQ